MAEKIQCVYCLYFSKKNSMRLEKKMENTVLERE